MKYHADTDALIQSDIEEIRKQPVPTSADDGTLKALVLDFNLPSSSYATMALREILKQDTSAASQCRLQQQETAKRTHDSTDKLDDSEIEEKKPRLEEATSETA